MQQALAIATNGGAYLPELRFAGCGELARVLDLADEE